MEEKLTESLCPGCVEEGKFEQMIIKAKLYEKEGKILMEKECPEHGKVKEVYYGDALMYKRVMRYLSKGIKFENPDISRKNITCPLNCGLCREHESHTALGNIVLTNRCDLSCWYCFFYAKEGEPIYEPSLEQIREMLRKMKEKRPVGANAVQLTGGEPALREDILEIIKICKEEGYQHIQFNTNGIKLSQEPELAKNLRKAGVNTVYMSFDGLDPKTNPKNYWEVPQAIENCREANLGLVLVPTLIKGYNDQQIGKIVKFAAAHIDIIRAVNFQPVSLVGRMPKKERVKQRITIPEVLNKLEKQTDGEIRKDDFFPVPATTKISGLLETLRGENLYKLSIHPVCGAGTYLYVENNTLVPINRFIKVEEFLEEMEKKGKRIKKINHWLEKILGNLKGYLGDKIGFFLKKKLRAEFKSYVIWEKVPSTLDINFFLRNLTEGNYEALGKLHSKFLFIGNMHFMDPYNYDLERVKRCDIHYATPDNRIIPFCAFNVLPELYRDKIQRKFSLSAKEWEKKHKKKISDDKYKRKLSEEEKAKVSEFYRKSLEKIK